MEITYELLHLRQIEMLYSKTTCTRLNFTWIIVLFDETFKYDNGAKFWGYVRSNSEKIVQNSVILFTVISY
jgi:hypothetical protein